jgi:dienelactone hydrolase
MRVRLCLFILSWTFVLASLVRGQVPNPLPGTQPLTWTDDLSVRMVAGIDQFLLRETERALETRATFWKRDFASREAHEKSIQPNRERLRTILGAEDTRLPVNALEFVETSAHPSRVGETERYTVFAVRWPVFEGVQGEGLLLRPKGAARARVVALPDADQTPEMPAGLAPGVPAESHFARRLAENGCEVLVPTLVDRQDTHSGNARLKRFTNQPHREWIYRQAFELGRHVIGYEAQKVLAAVDWFAAQPAGGNAKPGIGVAGYGEGGLLALCAAALDPRLDAALVSGWFDSRQRLWEEPIYRNVFGLLREFGDAELASLIVPRPLIIEHSETPTLAGPPAASSGRGGAAPGKWQTPDFASVEAEVHRADALTASLKGRPAIRFFHGNEGQPLSFGSDNALLAFVQALQPGLKNLVPPGRPAADARGAFDPAPRQQRQVAELTAHTQRLLRECERFRDEAFWRPLKGQTAERWAKERAPQQERFWTEVLGRFPPASVPVNARSRKVEESERWTSYDVVLDVWPDVFAWGVLLLPKDLKPGERRPVVVCQHGLEGLPADTITTDPKVPGFPSYKGFAARLAERGFVVFAPHNPYRGRDAFRSLQRKANPLGRSLFSIILAQHERILDWLGEQPFVDASRIGFYGLSYGGKTAMRVPALLDRYCLSICSADFNEWVTKNATVDSPYSYLFTGEYEIFEWNLGHTFNYAEMAALIAPRPFMVERGHDDGVAPDEWVAHEFARVRRFYAKLGVPERAEIEFFNGPHTIHGQGTFRFLHRHLDWPEPGGPAVR